MTVIRHQPISSMPPLGFSLVEMLVVIAIVAILAALAVPSFNDLISEQRQRSAASDLAGDLAEARGEAMKRSRRVVVQADPAGWLNGWSILVDTGEPFVDSDGDGIYSAGETFVDVNSDGVRNSASVLLKTIPGFAGSTMRICGVSGAATNAGAFVARVVFQGDGTVANAGIGADDGIRISDIVSRSREIRVSPAGRVSVDSYRSGDPNRNLFGPCP